MISIIFKRGFFAPLLIALALTTTILLSVMLTSEYVANAQLNDNLDRALVDAKMVIRVTNFVEYHDLYSELSSLEEVKWIQMFFSKVDREIIVSSKEGKLDFSRGDESVLILGLNFSNWSSNLTLVDGRFPNAVDEVALDKKIAEILNVSIGENITIGTQYGGLRENFTLVGIIETKGLLSETITNDYLIENKVPQLTSNTTKNYAGVLYFTMESSVGTKGVGRISPPLPNFLIKYERRAFVDPWNPSIMIKKVDRIEGKIINIALKYTAITQIQYFSYVKDVLKDYATWPSGFRLQLSYMVLSITFTGGIFSFFIGWIFTNQRKRELAILKIRGYSNLQIFKLMVVEYVIIGLLAALLGLSIAAIISSLSPYLILSYFATKYNPIPIVLSNLVNYFYASLIYGFFFGFIAVFPAFIAAMKLNIQEGLSDYTKEFEETRFSLYHVIGLIYGAFGFVEVLLDFPILRLTTQGLMASKSALLQVFGFILLMIDAIVISSGPFVFAYSLSYTVSHFSSHFEGLLTRLSKIVSKRSASYLAIKHFIRRPARVARLIFLIAILFSLLMESGLNYTLTNSMLEENVKLFVGSDYRVDIYDAPRNKNFTEIRNLLVLNSSGITVSAVYEYWGYVKSYGFPYIKVLAVDENYFKSAFLDNSYFDKLGVAGAYNVLFSENKALLSLSGKEIFNATIGSNISLTVSKRSGFIKKFIRVEIGGFFSFAPGLLNDVYGAQKSDFVVMIINVNKIKEILGFPDKILIKKPKSLNDKLFSSGLVKILRENGILAAIYSYEVLLKLALNKSLSGIMANLYKMEFVELLLLTALGSYILLYSEYITRKREFAVLLSRGIEEEDIHIITILESVLILIFSTTVGLIISFNLSLTLQRMVQIGLFGLLVFPNLLLYGFRLEVLYLILIELFAIFISIRIAIKRSMKIKLAEELRVRH